MLSEYNIYIKFNLTLLILAVSAGLIFYPIQEFTDLENQVIYSISLGLGGIITGFTMFYLTKLHRILFKKTITYSSNGTQIEKN